MSIFKYKIVKTEYSAGYCTFQPKWGIKFIPFIWNSYYRYTDPYGDPIKVVYYSLEDAEKLLKDEIKSEAKNKVVKRRNFRYPYQDYV